MSISNKIFTCILTFLVFNQVVFAQDSLAIGSDEITDIVNRVASIMTDKYVDPETGRKMANHIVSRHEKGAYGKHTDIESFCSAA